MKNENRTIYGQKIIVDLPTRKSDKQSDYYIKWHHMLERCYDSKYQKKHPTYIGCTVSSEWYKLSIFKDWYCSQPNYGKSDMQLDKDILVRGNKIYGSQYCRLVPQRINKLLTDSRASRGIYPIGVCFDESRGKYMSYCSDGKKLKTLGRFNDPDSAFTAYKKYKEALIKDVAGEYYAQNLIGADIYDALQNWTI